MISKLLLVHYNQTALAEAWSYYFQFEKEVEITKGNIFDFDWDAMVSPGNSFGFMDGGIDLQISKQFGWEVQAELRKRIEASDLKELLVGQAETIPIKNSAKQIICAPTMRVPQKGIIPHSVNAYLAMKAALIEASKNENIQKLAVPGLCTGTGGMNPKVSAQQMFIAFSEIVKGVRPEFHSYLDAKNYHFRLNPGKSLS